MADHAKETKIPLILILIGVGLYALGGFIHAGASGAAGTVIASLIRAAIGTAVMIGAAFITAKIVGISFGELNTAALKFAAAFLASGGAATLIPMGGILGFFVFLGIILWLFELEVWQAVLLTFIYVVISLIIGFAMRSALA